MKTITVDNYSTAADSSGGDGEGDKNSAKVLEFAMRESMVLKRLEHPNIVKYFDSYT